MSNNLFIFGDSFSNSFVRILYDKYELEGKGELWWEIVANKLNFNVKNHSIGSKSNLLLLSELLEQQKYISKNDIVVVSLTHSARIDLYFEEEQRFWAGTPFWENVDTPMYYKDEHISVQNFVSEWISPYIRVYDNLYSKMLNNIVATLPCKTVVWNREIYKDFESIELATGGEHKDSHWSWKGQQDFAEYILKSINSKGKSLV